MHYNINDSAESAQKTKKYKRGIFMKIKRIIAGILVAATCGLAMAGCQSNTTGGKLIMATEPGFAPYEYMSGNNVVGIDVDIAQAICDKLGYELKVEDMEFDAIVNAVKSGKADFGAAGMTVTEDRKKSVDFTDPYTTAEQVIIVQK